MTFSTARFIKLQAQKIRYSLQSLMLSPNKDWLHTLFRIGRIFEFSTTGGQENFHHVIDWSRTPHGKRSWPSKWRDWHCRVSCKAGQSSTQNMPMTCWRICHLKPLSHFKVASKLPQRRSAQIPDQKNLRPPPKLSLSRYQCVWFYSFKKL